MEVMKIKPNPDCKLCYGTGEVFDIVDYGATTTSLPSLCSCIEEQIPEDFDGEVEIEYND